MKIRIEYKTVCAVIFGCIIVTFINLVMANNLVGFGQYAIILSGCVVITLATMCGMIPGLLIPITAGGVCAAILPGTVAAEEVIILIILGVSSGHYVDKLLVAKGKFSGRNIIDFLTVQFVLGVVLWIFIYPMAYFLIYKSSVLPEIISGINLFAISFVLVLFVCVPILVIFSKYYLKKNVMAEAIDKK